MQQNNQNHSLSKCQKHSFSLKAYEKQRRYNLNATVNMCSRKQQKKGKNKDQCGQFQGPLFNDDKCHASLAFIASSQKKQYQKSTNELIEDHDKKVKQYQQIDELLVPKPRSKSMYCNVCRQNYQQYIEHIDSSKHKERIKHSIYNRLILDLEKKFQKNERKQIIIICNQTAKTSDQDQVQIINQSSKARKKRKSETVAQNSTPTYPFMNPNFNVNAMFNSQLRNPFCSYPFINGFGVPYPFICASYQPINLQMCSQRY